MICPSLLWPSHTGSRTGATRRPPHRKTFYGFENLPDLAVRHGQWKLLCDYDGGRPHLYNLITDPGESKNLAEAHPETAQELTKKVTAWYRSMPSIK